MPYDSCFIFHFHSIDKIWIIGDSIVRWAAWHILHKEPSNPDLNLGLELADVVWKGWSGMRLHHTLENLRMWCINSKDLPSIILLHVGTNDLIRTPVQEIQWLVQQLVKEIYELIPHVSIIWSEILPRLAYRGARDQVKVNIARKTLNRRVRAIMGRCGGHIIRHAEFNASRTELFRKDGIHLSPDGNDLLVNNFTEGLRFFMLYNNMFNYPPF